jgi:hypothetical protein
MSATSPKSSVDGVVNQRFQSSLCNEFVEHTKGGQAPPTYEHSGSEFRSSLCALNNGLVFILKTALKLFWLLPGKPAAFLGRLRGERR